MSEKTNIGWTDHTFNPVWGCTKVSRGCKFCFANSVSSRYGFDVWGPNKPRRTFGEKHWAEPLKWNRMAQSERYPHTVFCGSMCDVAEDHPTTAEEVRKLWPLIRATPWLQWQLLSKRPDRYEYILPSDWGNGYENVWLGTSVEDNRVASRIDALIDVPAKLHWISAEPLIGSLADCDFSMMNWIVFGGESGAGHRVMDLSWMADAIDRCLREGIPIYVKQDSARLPGQQGRISDEHWALKQIPGMAVTP